MNSLKNFKRLIIEGKQSPLQIDARPSADLKIPEIRESAYKIIHRKKLGEDSKKQHSITKKQQIKIPSKSGNSSPLKVDRQVLRDVTKDLHNTETSLYRTGDPKLRLLELTQQELECLEGIINAQKQTTEKRLKEVEKVTRIHQKISTLRKGCSSSQQSKSQLSNYGRSHHSSSHQTEVLSVPSSFEDLNESNTTTHQKLRQQTNQTEDNLHQKSDIEFKKIMYILESKSRAMESLGELRPQNLNPKQPTNSYRLIQEVATPSISFRGQPKDPPKKAELMEIVSMLNTKYKRNIKFN